MDTLHQDRQSALTGADLVAAAKAMIPFLREHEQETNTLRHPPEAVRLRLKAEGFARVFQPRHYGGAQATLVEGAEMLRELANGCGSTAWAVVQYVLHNYMLAHWSRQAQDEVWERTPDALLSGILIPGIGKAIKVEGGYRLSGRWPFVSGVELADWVIFTGECVLEESQAPHEFHFVLPKQHVTILDTWYTIGLKGSSSQDVVVEDVFVPDHRVASERDFKGHGQSIGSTFNSAPLYRVPPYSIFGAFIGSAALGIAEAAVEHYLVSARKRAATMTGGNIANYATQQVKVAEAQCAVLAAHHLIRSVLEETQALFDSGGSTTEEDRTRCRALATYAGKLSSSAVSLVLEAGGGAVIYERNPIARYICDITVANRHVTQNWDINASTYGRVLLGLPCGNPALAD